MTAGTVTVLGLKIGFSSPVLWLVILPASLAAGFWGPTLICDLAYTARRLVLPLVIVAAIVLAAGYYMKSGGARS